MGTGELLAVMAYYFENSKTNEMLYDSIKQILYFGGQKGQQRKICKLVKLLETDFKSAKL